MDTENTPDVAEMIEALPQPEEPEVIKAKADADGNRWTHEQEHGQTRVHLLTKDGRSLNVLADSLAAGKKHLTEYIKR